MEEATAPQIGTSTPLTETEGASVFEGLLSAQEESEDRETPPAKPKAKPESEEAAEATDEEVEETPAETVEVEEGAETEEESETDASESESETEQPELHTVKINGVEEKVTLDELKKGYSRTKDYTQKTQATAEEKKAVSAERATMRERIEQYSTLLPKLQQALETVTPQEPDWDKVQAETPDQFTALWARWQQYTKRRDALAAEQRKSAEELETVRRRDHAEMLERENTALLEALPEWKKDSQKAKAEMQELVDFAQEHGYTREEALAAADHRVILLLRKAMLYDRQQAKKDAVRPKVAEKVKAAKPGPAGSAKKPTKVGRALQRLAKSGSIEDGAALFEEILD